MANEEHRLRCEALVKAYRERRVVDQVSLGISSGEIVGLLGPNGAGKTTTFYMIVGLIKPEKGRVFIDNHEITDMPMYQRARRGIGYLPQEPSVFRKLTVEENLLAIIETLPVKRSQYQELLEKLLSELGITHLAKVRADALSGGERRRLEITRALITNPAFILLDEPFAGIDPLAVIDIQNIIQQLKAKGIGVLVTDHNVRVTLEITDRAYIINEGKILADGTPFELANSEKVRKFYLGEKFRLEQEINR